MLTKHWICSLISRNILKGLKKGSAEAGLYLLDRHGLEAGFHFEFCAVYELYIFCASKITNWGVLIG